MKSLFLAAVAAATLAAPAPSLAQVNTVASENALHSLATTQQVFHDQQNRPAINSDPQRLTLGDRNNVYTQSGVHAAEQRLNMSHDTQTAGSLDQAGRNRVGTENAIRAIVNRLPARPHVVNHRDDADSVI